MRCDTSHSARSWTRKTSRTGSNYRDLVVGGVRAQVAAINGIPVLADVIDQSRATFEPLVAYIAPVRTLVAMFDHVVIVAIPVHQRTNNLADRLVSSPSEYEHTCTHPKLFSRWFARSVKRISELVIEQV